MPLYKDSPENPLSSKTAEGKVYIGTSGWVHDWDFYPPRSSEEDKLSHIGDHFNSVEITQSFFELPTKRTFKEWAQKTPENFKFSAHLSSDITHKKRLKRAKGAAREFLERFEALEEKTGPILIQLDSEYSKKPWLLDEFLEGAEDVRIGLRHGDKIRFAFDPRHDSWYSPEIIEILKKYNTALVFSHSEELPYPEDEPITADFVYVRMFGPDKAYASRYGKSNLQEWAKKIKKWQSEGRDVYVYFNNDLNGHAPKDANDLRDLIFKE